MFNRQLNEDEQILQTIQLTAKLENSLRKIMSNRRNNIKTQYDDKDLDQSQHSNIQTDLKQLRKQNKQLTEDNEKLCRDLLRLKEQNRQIKNELSQHKKYIAYLQGYTQDLKKQLVFWMRKPLPPNLQQQEESFGTLMTEVLKLRKENELREVQLDALKSTLEPVREKMPQKHKRKTTMPLFSESQMGLSLGLKTKKKNNSISSNTNACTSCNYIAYSKAKKRFIPNSSSFGYHKGKGSNKLCECHSKYVETSQFMY